MVLLPASVRVWVRCSGFSSRRNQTKAGNKPNKAAGRDTTTPRGTALGSRAPGGSRAPQQHRTGRRGWETHSTTPRDAHRTMHSSKQHHAATHHSKTNTARRDTTKHSAGRHRTPGRQTATGHTTPQDQTEQNETTQRRAAQSAATRRSTAPRDTPQQTPETRHQERPGPTRRQLGTARPNSQHANRTDNNTKTPASAAGVRRQRTESNNAGTPAQHRTSRAQKQKQPGAPRKGKEQRHKIKPAENAATHESKAPQQQHITAQHNTAQDHKHATQQRTQHKTHHRQQHNTTRRTTNHNTGQHNQPPAGGGTTSTNLTQNKNPPRQAPEGSGGQHHRAATRGSKGKSNPASTAQPGTHNTTGNKTKGGETGKGHRKTERKRTPAPAEAQGPQQHTPTRPTAHDTPARHRTVSTARKKREAKETWKKKNPNKHAEGGEKKSETKERGGKDHKTPRPKAPRAEKHGTPERGGAQKEGRKKKRINTSRATPARRWSSGLRATRTATGKGEAHQHALGRPARPTSPRKHAHAHTHTTRAWRPPTLKGRSWHTKQPRCTDQVPRRKTGVTGNQTRQ